MMTYEYIAGFVDGEGSIITNGNRIRLTITNTDKHVLELIRDMLGHGSVYELTKRQSHWKDSWMYSTTSIFGTVDVLQQIRDYLIIKQESADLAIEFGLAYLREQSEYANRKEMAVELVGKGKSYREAERITGVGRTTIYRLLKSSS